MTRPSAQLIFVGSFEHDPVAVQSGDGEPGESFTFPHAMDRFRRLLLGSGHRIPLFLRLLLCLVRRPDGMKTPSGKHEADNNQYVRQCTDHKFRSTKKDKLKQDLL